MATQGCYRTSFMSALFCPELGITRKTMRKWLNRWEKKWLPSGTSENRSTTKNKGGTDREIIEEARRNPITKAKFIRGRLQFDVSVRTVRRRLHEHDYHHQSPAMKEKLRLVYTIGNDRLAAQLVSKFFRPSGIFRRFRSTRTRTFR